MKSRSKSSNGYPRLNICKEDKKCLMRIRNEYGFKSLNNALSFCIQSVYDDLVGEFIIEKNVEE